MNQKKFLAIIEPLEPKLFGFAFRMLRDEDKVKDAMQELNLKLWNKRKELNISENISAYCFRMIHNICMDEFRYEESKRRVSSSRTRGPNSTRNQQLMEPHVEPLELDLERKELIQNIRKEIDRLPDKQKAIIELHDFQEMSHPEIAEILDMEVNAVRVNLSRARAKITAQFKKEEIYE